MTSTPSDCQRRSKILLDATVQFCAHRKHAGADAGDQYSKLFYSLIGDTDTATRKLISSRLARCHTTPRAIAYYLAMEPVEIASPFLLISPVFWERDILQLIEKLDVASLSIIARRSDMNTKIAQAIVSRKDKVSCRVLAKNPILRLNNLVGENKSGEPSTSGIGTNDHAREELMELARASGKIGSINPASNPAPPTNSAPPMSLPERLLEHANANNSELVAAEIAMHIDMPVENVVKLVRHENSSSLTLFLKGLNLSRSQASQLLLLINKRTGRNIAEFTGSMEQFDRFSVSQCQDIMRNLGAGKIPDMRQSNVTGAQESVLENAVNLRRRQIRTAPGQTLFGAQRKAG